MNEKRFIWDGSLSKIIDNELNRTISDHLDCVDALNELNHECKNREKLNHILEGFLLHEGYNYEDIKNFVSNRVKQ